MSRVIASSFIGLALMPTLAHAAETAGSGGLLLQVLSGLGTVLALLAATAWALRRFGVKRGHAASPLKIIGGISVGTRERVMLLEVADQWIVIGVAPGQVNTLSTMPKQQGLTGDDGSSTQENPDRSQTQGIPFANWLRQTIERRHGK